MPRITEMVVRNAKAPERDPYVIFDDLVKGFGFRLVPRRRTVLGGRYFPQYEKEEITIGRYPEVFPLAGAGAPKDDTG